MVAQVALLLKRLLHGEEPHPELFEHLRASFDLITNIDGDIASEIAQTLESLIVYRILNMLGYVGVTEKLDQELISAPLSMELIRECTPFRMILNAQINKALKESQL